MHRSPALQPPQPRRPAEPRHPSATPVDNYLNRLDRSTAHHYLGFTYSSPQSTPLPTSHSLSPPPSDESVEPSGPYPELVGCLMYLMTCTRPDLAYPLSILAGYVAPGRHRKEHMDATKRVLRYLCSTSSMGLVLGGRAQVVLTGHADASWVDYLATQRSSQSYTFSLGSGSVSWHSTRSSSVLSSSCEAEIYAGAMAAQELRWLTYLLTDLGEAPRSPPVPYVDNKAMLALCQEHRLEHRTKHIALCYFLARELQQHGQLRLAYVATHANTADIFTKALQPCDHQRFSTMLGCVHCIACEKRNEPPPSNTEALDGSNYEEWVGRMRSAFKRYKLLKLAMGEEKMPEEGNARDRWIEKSAVLYDLILQSVNNYMFQNINDLVELDDSGPKAWKLLRDVIQPNTLPMVIVLENELAALSMRQGDDVKPVLDKIKDTYARMAAAGSNVSQMQQCTKIISVLDNSWGNLIPSRTSGHLSGYGSRFCRKISASAIRVVVLPTKLLRGMELQEAAEEEGEGEAEAVGETLAEGEAEVTTTRGMGALVAGEALEWRVPAGSGAQGDGALDKANPGMFLMVEDGKGSEGDVGSVGKVVMHPLTHWVINSGCTSQMTPWADLLDEVKPLGNNNFVAAALGALLPVIGVGNAKLLLWNLEEKSGCIKDLWQLPIIPWNGKPPATAAAAATAKATAEGEETAPTDGALDAVKKASSGSGEADWETWHEGLCHVNFPMLQKLVKDGSLKGLEVKGAAKEIGSCPTCLETKFTKFPFSSGTGPAKAPLALEHKDVVGPTRAPSLSGSRYFLTIVDDHTRAVWVYPLKTKGEVAAAVLKEWMLRAQRESGHKVKVIRIDNGGEFIGNEFEAVLKKKGIQHQLTVPYNPQQNGVAEHFNRTLQEGARTLLGRAGLPDPFWVTALRQVALLKNRVLASVGDKHAVRQRQQWGAADLSKGEMLLTCYTDASFNSMKADGTSIGGYVCLFGGGAVSWRSKKHNEPAIAVCYHPTLRRVFPSQDVKFDKSVPFYRLFPYRSAPPPPPPLFLAPSPPPVDPLPPQGPAPSGVSQVDPLPGPAPIQVAVGSGAPRGATSGGAEPEGALTPPLLCAPLDQSQPPLQPASPLPAPSRYIEQSGGLTQHREPASRPVLPVRTARGIPRSRPPSVPGTHAMTLVPLPAPPESSLFEVPDPESNRNRAASPSISRLLATDITDPLFEFVGASALVAKLLDFAAASRLDYTTDLVAESTSAGPPSIEGECALGTDVLEDRQEDFECLAATVPRFTSMLLAPEGDPDATLFEV
ncbi:unnamed protein product [Closterium sp. NIES-54]